MSVRVRVLGEEFVLPCAEGDQNIKWLAIAAVRLYSALHQHNYCLRQRERLVSESGVVLPHNVRQLRTNANLDPEDTINTTLEDGETVEVDVKKTIKLGRHGIPEPSEFHAKVCVVEHHRRVFTKHGFRSLRLFLSSLRGVEGEKWHCLLEY